MKTLILFLLFLSSSLGLGAEKNIRVNFKNQSIEVLPIKPHQGKASITLENTSFKNFTLRLIKNDEPLRYINLEMSSTKTLDVDLVASDTLSITPYNPSMSRLELITGK